MQNDNIAQAVEQPKSWRRDENLLVRFYTGETNSEFVDAWIDGLSWRHYDFNMRDYLQEEYLNQVKKMLPKFALPMAYSAFASMISSMSCLLTPIWMYFLQHSAVVRLIFSL